MSLENLAENIYNGNVSLDAAKQEQRKMENMLESFIDYNSIKNIYKSKKVNTLLNTRELYKGRREILIAFEEDMFPLPKLYVFGENEWKERDIPDNEKFMPKTFKLSFQKKISKLNFLKKKTNFQIEISEFGDAEGKVLKILTPNLMLQRLPVTLAKLKGGNNSEKLKK